MKALRYLAVHLLISIIMMLQACGSGGGTSDSAGSLTISSPTITDNNDGSFSVSATVTYAPPAGKSAQGVVVTTTATDSFGNVTSNNSTLTSGSNSVVYTYHVLQNIGTSTSLFIVSNIGGMNASVSAVIPAISPLSAPSIQFKSTDALGTNLTSGITGGVKPYRLVSVSTTDISATLIGLTLNVVNNKTGSTPTTATINISDSIGSNLAVSVKYFTP